jgi:PSP1-like protein
MADPVTDTTPIQPSGTDREALIDNARKQARRRFKERLDSGLSVAGCECESDNGDSDGPTSRVAGVRFLDSGQTYFFDPGSFEIENGDWVVVETNRGLEAGKVVIAPSQMLQASLSGNLKPINRILGEPEIERMQALKREAAKAVKTFGAKIREHNLPMKPISAEYNFDGASTSASWPGTSDRAFAVALSCVRSVRATRPGCWAVWAAVGGRSAARRGFRSSRRSR